MTRKSVSYLTVIRAEVAETLHEMTEAAFDFSNLATDYDMGSIDQVRTGQDEDYKSLMKLERYLAKKIKEHKEAVKKLKDFF